jgi:hypothetical protein
MYKDEDAVPPIVSEELWQRANNILKNRSEKQSSEDRTSYQNKYPYSGKIICSEHGVPYYRSLYKYSSGSREVWQCRKYAEKGREGCTLPAIYTEELNVIIKNVYDKILTDRSKIIHDMTALYSDIGSRSKIKEDITKIKAEINKVIKMKDRLLELSINGRISDDEFEKRNNRFNTDIDSFNIKLIELDLEELKNKELGCSAEILRNAIENEINYDEGFSNELIDTVLDKIEVYRTDRKNTANVRFFFKGMCEPVDYKILREKKGISVCSVQYI